MQPRDTIAAIATAPGIGGIGIIRLSGPQSVKIAQALSNSKLQKSKIQFRRFYDADSSLLDHGLCLYFKSPASFTGEDCVEIQAHGGPVILDILLERVCKLGARLARAGEFSERAFLNGKIDLTQAEAIADLIEAGSRAASKAAMRSLDGVFSTQVTTLTEEVIHLRAFIEAALDFAEEEIDFLKNSDIEQRLKICLERLTKLLNQAQQGRLLQEGLTVAIAGLPNAGKSSLLNFFAGYDAAIVTDIAGTTRDLLREHISLKGVPLKLIDTAGLTETDNPVEKEGVRRAWLEIQKADLVLFLIDATKLDAKKGISAQDQKYIDELTEVSLQVVFSKSDLLAKQPSKQDKEIYISTGTGDGMENLVKRITGDISDYNQDNQVFMARRRHVDALTKALEFLRQAEHSFSHSNSAELVAQDLADVQKQLNEITGEFSSDDLLGKIFSQFCIGK